METLKEQLDKLLKKVKEAKDHQIDYSDINESDIELLKKLEADSSKIIEVYEWCYKMHYEKHDDLNALEKAELELVTAFAVNSLFFAINQLKGEDETYIKKQLGRVKAVMNRLKQIQAVANRPETTSVVAKRMIHKALAVKRKKDDAEIIISKQNKASNSDNKQECCELVNGTNDICESADELPKDSNKFPMRDNVSPIESEQNESSNSDNEAQETAGKLQVDSDEPSRGYNVTIKGN